jgi:hypothetical protein
MKSNATSKSDRRTNEFPSVSISLAQSLIDFAQAEADADPIIAGNFSAFIRQLIVERRTKRVADEAARKNGGVNGAK